MASETNIDLSSNSRLEKSGVIFKEDIMSLMGSVTHISERKLNMVLKKELK